MSKHWKLKHDKLLSNAAFNVNLRRYTRDSTLHLLLRPAGSAATATDIRYAPPEHSPLPLGTAPESPQSISFHQY